MPRLTDRPAPRVTLLDLTDKERLAEWNRKNKPPTWTQVLMECAKALGLKTGSLAERRRRAVAARPDIYAPVIKPGWTDGCRRVLGATYGEFEERTCRG